MGELATKMLLENINDRKIIEQVNLDAELIIWKSTQNV